MDSNRRLPSSERRSTFPNSLATQSGLLVVEVVMQYADKRRRVVLLWSPAIERSQPHRPFIGQGFRVRYVRSSIPLDMIRYRTYDIIDAFALQGVIQLQRFQRLHLH